MSLSCLSAYPSEFRGAGNPEHTISWTEEDDYEEGLVTYIANVSTDNSSDDWGFNLTFLWPMMAEGDEGRARMQWNGSDGSGKLVREDRPEVESEFSESGQPQVPWACLQV